MAVLVAILVIIADRYNIGGLFRKDVPSGPFSGPVRIIDGDSLFVGNFELRLQGIDAPEGRQKCQRKGRDWPCGRRSADHLRRLMQVKGLTCAASRRDRYDRLLATCQANGKNINEQMVADGWAVAFGRYDRQERAAKAAKRGIWAGQFQRPRLWRQEHRRND